MKSAIEQIRELRSLNGKWEGGKLEEFVSKRRVINILEKARDEWKFKFNKARKKSRDDIVIITLDWCDDRIDEIIGKKG